MFIGPAGLLYLGYELYKQKKKLGGLIARFSPQGLMISGTTIPWSNLSKTEIVRADETSWVLFVFYSITDSETNQEQNSFQSVKFDENSSRNASQLFEILEIYKQTYA